MKIFFQFVTACILLIAGSAAFGYYYWYLPKFKPAHHTASVALPKEVPKSILAKIKTNLASVKATCHSGDYNSRHCFLIDMSISSGKKRFFIYNLEKDSIERSGLVTHGSGSDKDGSASYFSNVSGSNCTSLGKYKIGNSYQGRFGLAFKLHGLDKTNNKAFDRAVVLHSHGCVPNDEVAPFPICLSLGCPTVSPDFLALLKKYINESEKPILLSIYK